MSRARAHGPRPRRAAGGPRPFHLLALAGIAAAGLAAGWPVSALAAEEAPGHPWLDLLWKAINLAVLVGLIAYFGRKPIAAALRALAKETYDRWSKAHQAAEATQADLAAQRKQIEGLESELKRMAGDAAADAAREHERVVEEARQQAERIMTLARGQVEQEMAKARTELRQQLADETVRLAQQMIEKQATSDQRKKLMEAYLREMEARR